MHPSSETRHKKQGTGDGALGLQPFQSLGNLGAFDFRGDLVAHGGGAVGLGG